MLILAKGISPTNTLTHFLTPFCPPPGETASPHLIFLLNCPDSLLQGLTLPIYTPVLAESSSKRAQRYMKGGLFAVTAKTLALDLLGKKFSGAIVTGFILFEFEKVEPHSIETFLIRVLK